jgi:hypothetical protein
VSSIRSSKAVLSRWLAEFDVVFTDYKRALYLTPAKELKVRYKKAATSASARTSARTMAFKDIIQWFLNNEELGKSLLQEDLDQVPQKRTDSRVLARDAAALQFSLLCSLPASEHPSGAIPTSLNL